MKAITSRQYGTPDVLALEEIEQPKPKNKELLIKVNASAVTSGDARIRGLNVPFGFKFITRLLFGFNKPKQPVLGTVFSGVVAATGDEITEFKVGDEVFGASNNFGSHAEYVVVPEAGPIAIKPANCSFNEAAAIPFGALTSLKYLRDFGKIKAGEKILINGASGALGVYGVQLAKHYGAHVTGMCSTANVPLVKSLGADAVIDYTTTDFTRNGEAYDIIYDTVGKITLSVSKNSLTKSGRLLLAAAGISQYFQVLFTSIFSKKKVIAGVAVFNKKDVAVIKELVSSGKLRSVIGKQFPLSETKEAHIYVDTGHKVGSAVITM